MIEPLPADGAALALAYAHPLAEGRPYVRANMISSLDGSSTAAGRSGGLGGDGDRRVFGALRAAADVVLVGAATVRDEDYGTPERPALAIVTRGTIARTDRLYPPSGAEPIVYSGHGESVDLRAVLGDLYARGHRRVLAEGGPGVLGALLAAGLVDELCLTVAPVLAGGDGRRIVTGPDLPLDRWQRRLVLGDDEGYLYTRWAR
ncbi:dihydrofolate reductase family protein [Tsukamurella tyrosinosolvens]|uniref:dihydrofolate reductase family protein n=1 Tax=Tsukamurella tyrosinosolvens TaxID=57704 RepID=UPI002DD433CB|nr:dihydrofolate reductase family protein [Tsukamurella tyrosinosolvens]MEC4614044.1 dihydrofolate reductase family protein [Tsukamurella tyrosinosolvens]